MKPQYINLVFVRHGGSKPYLFQSPMQETIQKGEQLIVNTRCGQDYGVASSNSFICTVNAASEIVTAVGGYCPLARVIGKVVQQKTEFHWADQDELPF